MQWLGIAVFAAVAFGVSWGLLAALAQAPFDRTPVVVGPFVPLPLVPFSLTALFIVPVLIQAAPALGSIVARLAEKSGFSDAGLRWGRGRYHLAAWLLPFAVSSVAFALVAVVPEARLYPSATSTGPGLSAEQHAVTQRIIASWDGWTSVFVIARSMTEGVAVALVAAFAEELGWRGYLQRRLTRLGAMRAMLIVGAAWGIWHAPVIMRGYGNPYAGGAAIVLMIAYCTAWSVFLGWLFVASESVLVPTVGHASINSSADLLGTLAVRTGPAAVRAHGVVLIAVAWCLVAWVWRTQLKPLSHHAQDSGDTRLSH